MGTTLISIPFFDDAIKIKPHTASMARHVGKIVSIEKFSNEAARAVGNRERLDRGGVRLLKIEETGELRAEFINAGRMVEFIEGPEAK